MSQNQRNKYPLNWQTLRVCILVRDKFCCTICGRSEVSLRSKKMKKIKLHVMHLDGNTFNNLYTLTPPYFNNPNNNLASGCPICHKLFDAILGNSKKDPSVKNFQTIDISSINLK
jgi:hypothetical protein